MARTVCLFIGYGRGDSGTVSAAEPLLADG
jgi:hypothetical protein